MTTYENSAGLQGVARLACHFPPQTPLSTLPNVWSWSDFLYPCSPCIGLGDDFIVVVSMQLKSNLCKWWKRRNRSREFKQYNECLCCLMKSGGKKVFLRWPSFLLISISAKRPTLIICQSSPRTRWGFPAIRSWASMLTTVQPIAEAEFRASTRFSYKCKWIVHQHINFCSKSAIL